MDFRSLKKSFLENQSKLAWLIPPFVFAILLLIGSEPRYGFAFGFISLVAVIQFKAHRTMVKNNRNTIYSDPDFTIYKSMVILIVAVMRADGSVSAEEIKVVERKFKKEYLPGEYRRLAKNLKKELERSVPQLDEHLSRIDEDFTLNEKIQLLFLLVAIAVSDKILTATEEQLLQKIVNGIGIPYKTMDSILAMFRFRREYEQHSRKNSKSVSQVALENAYKILEIDSSATDAEIKKAYKRLAILHHPDKVAHLGEQMQRTASEKFKILVGAYDLICKKRGIN